MIIKNPEDLKLTHVVGFKDPDKSLYRTPIILQKHVELDGQIVPGGYYWRLLNSILEIDGSQDGTVGPIMKNKIEAFDFASRLGYTIFGNNDIFDLFGEVITTFKQDKIETFLARSALSI